MPAKSWEKRRGSLAPNASRNKDSSTSSSGAYPGLVVWRAPMKPPASCSDLPASVTFICGWPTLRDFLVSCCRFAARMDRMNCIRLGVLVALAPLIVPAQPTKPKPPKPLDAQSSSTLKYATDADGAQFFEIHNVAYEMATNIPGRAPADWLVLRKTTHSKEVIGDIGVQATVTLEAWPLGNDLKQK